MPVVHLQVTTAPSPFQLPMSSLTHLHSRLSGSQVLWVTEASVVFQGLGAHGLRLSTYTFLSKCLQRNVEATGHKPVIQLSNLLYFIDYVGKYIYRNV